DPVLLTTSSRYDSAGDLIGQSLVGDSFTSAMAWSFDMSGQQVSDVDGDSIGTSRTIDGAGRLLPGTPRRGSPGGRFYDHADRLIATVDARNITTSFAYDAAGDVTSEVIGGIPVTTGYDRVGHPTFSIDVGGMTTSSTYEGDNLVLQVKSGAGVSGVES